MGTQAPPTVADIRAEIARQNVTKYQLAAQAHIHPGRLSEFLNERREMPPAIAQRVWDALHGVADVTLNPLLLVERCHDPDVESQVTALLVLLKSRTPERKETLDMPLKATQRLKTGGTDNAHAPR